MDGFACDLEDPVGHQAAAGCDDSRRAGALVAQQFGLRGAQFAVADSSGSRKEDCAFLFERPL